ncbi:hypothetical protein RCL1_004233 [Eukaryota sp. TZLM3-RCL]
MSFNISLSVSITLVLIVVLFIFYVGYRLYHSDFLNPRHEQLQKQLEDLDLQREQEQGHDFLIRLGARKQQKLDMKHERRRQLLIEQSERELLKKEREEQEERDRIIREKEIERERKLERQQQKIAEETERLRSIQYQQWKSHIKLTSQGFLNPSNDDADNLLMNSILDYGSNHRGPVSLSDVSSSFSISIKDLRQRLDRLMMSGRLFGYYDGGCYVFINNDSIPKIVAEINQRGSFSIDEFCDVCKQFI